MSATLIKRVGLALLLLAGMTALSLVWLFLGREQYVVYADGELLSVQGHYTTVKEVVTAAGLTLQAHDRVQPPLSESADPDVAIAVQRAKKVILRTEAGNQTYWTHQTTIGGFLAEIHFPTNRTDQIYADGRQLTFDAIFDTPLAEHIDVGNFATITVHDGGERRVIRTSKPTVGEALREAGIKIYAADATQPSLGSNIQPGLDIHIRRSKPLTIYVDGQIIQTRSHHETPPAVLAAAGITLAGKDYTLPGAESVLKPGDTVQVVRVTEDFRIVDDPIPYESRLQPTDQFEIDQRGILQAGIPGIKRTRVRVRYENGVEVTQTPDAEWVTQEPVDEIVGYGTRIVVRTLRTPDGAFEYWRKVRMRVTSYMAQTSGKPRSNPDYGITASGVPAGYGVVAIDPRVVPFQSEVYVPGYGRAFAGDTGGGVKGRWIDLGYPDDWDQFEHWSGYVDVYYLTPVPAPDKINYLLPDTLP